MEDVYPISKASFNRSGTLSEVDSLGVAWISAAGFLWTLSKERSGLGDFDCELYPCVSPCAELEEAK